MILIFRNQKEQFIDIKLLQKKTGRNYSMCEIKIDNYKIKKINNYLQNNCQKIPKIIHQIWIGDRPPPYKFINSFREDFMRKYQGWKYYLWDNESIKKLNLINDTIFNNEKTYHGKADILRYEILYQYGGIYIDADSYWLGLDLGKLIEQTNYTGFFAGRECKKCKESIASGVLGSSLNNPISKYLIDTLKENYYKYKNLPPYKKTGPYFVDQVLHNFNITIFPYYYFYPIYWIGKNSYNMSIEQQKKNFPNSYMTQYGYTTNNLKL